MHLRYVLLGVLLIVFAFASVFVSLKSLTNFVGNGGGATEFAMRPNQTFYYNFAINKTSILIASYAATANLSAYYLVNSTAFAQLEPEAKANQSLLPTAESLEGKGVVEIVLGSAGGAFPATSNVSTLSGTPIYAVPNSTVQPGAYYAIFTSSAASKNTTTIVFKAEGVSTAPTTAPSIGSSFELGSLGGVILFLLGIFFIVWGFFKRQPGEQPKKITFLPPKTKEQEAKDKRSEAAEVERLYAGIGAKPRAKPKAAKRRKTRK